mgnify:CR=1 FL=1|jgi:hypothetical protein
MSAPDNWIQTFSGTCFDLDAVSPANVLIHDVARSLSRIPRYMGHSTRIYSVAEHAVLAAQLAKMCGASALLQYACLHHDSAEAYVGDVVGPIRRYLGEEWKSLEERVEDAIAERFGLDFGFARDPFVVDIDLAMLEAERQKLMLSPPHPWKTSARAKPDLVEMALALVRVDGEQSRTWCRAFLDADRELGAGVRP